MFLVSLDDWISLTCSTVLFFQEGILVELRGVIFLRLLSRTKVSKMSRSNSPTNLSAGAGTSTGGTEQMRVFHDVNKVLPDFDPVSDALSINAWLDKIEEYGELYNWDDVAMKHYGLSKLTGVAKKWRDSLPSSKAPKSWKEWRDLLSETFGLEESKVNLRLEAQHYKWKSNQDIVEYFFEKLSRCNKCEMDVTETIEWIVDGLKNSRFREF